MKTFISYKHTGEDEAELRDFLSPIINGFKEIGVDAYCNLFDEGLFSRSLEYKPKDYVFDALNFLKEADFIFVILRSEEKSEGMLMEVGYAIASGVTIIVAIRNDIEKTYLPSMANLVIQWKNLDDLLFKIKSVDLKNIQ